ncbi:MAG: hypothetical protein WD768_14470 [Phycisphaeraceae bacterium]
MSEPTILGDAIAEMLRSMADECEAVARLRVSERGSASERRRSPERERARLGERVTATPEHTEPRERRARALPSERAATGPPSCNQYVNDVARGILNWAMCNGWKKAGELGRSRSGSVYIHLARRSDGERVYIRVSDHRLPRRVPIIDLEWITVEHGSIGVRWVREWLDERSER